jgi:hypothetical protein
LTQTLYFINPSECAQSLAVERVCVGCVGLVPCSQVPGTDAKGLGKALPMEMDIDAIMALLPHRYPFLLVDRVLEIEVGSYGKALPIKYVAQTLRISTV